MVDYPRWHLGGHNPVQVLHETEPEKLLAVSSDPVFLAQYDAVMAALDADISRCNTWFADKYPHLQPGSVAYFAAEFAIHNSLPIYAGGLGVLAGDVCKEASDLGLPLVVVGFMYPQGYFHQHISPEGWQEEVYQQLDFDIAPVNPCPWPQEGKPLVSVQLGNKLIYLGIWIVRLGCVNLYLLDTNIEENSPQDRQLSARLYAAEPEQRLQQQIILGVGGVRVLRALGIKPLVWHANEGYTVFMMLERLKEEVEQGVSYAEALHRVQTTTVFTTHTPVPAGNDIFPAELVERYLRHYLESVGMDWETFLKLGQPDDSSQQGFNMTVFGLRMARYRNAVSKLHGRVTRRMWHNLWPGVEEERVPITHITNGVHAPTWIAPEMARLYQKYLGEDLAKRQDDVKLLEQVLNIPDGEFWEVRQLLKRKLIHIILERAQQCWAGGGATPQQCLTMGALLDHDTFTIGFVRRFTDYKRPALLFYDLERLKRIVNSPLRPVQIIFAGKSHPADYPSKELLRKVYIMATDRAFQGRIAFVEDYDIHLAHYLVQGVDAWLNAPRRLQEACGTSGMKAALNGVPHLSVRDGWWHEGYNGANGWVIGDDSQPLSREEEDRADAESLYRLLEEEVIPRYYERDRSGIPRGWIHVAKEAIRSVLPVFGARRMLKEYAERMYLPAAQSVLKERLRP